MRLRIALLSLAVAAICGLGAAGALASGSSSPQGGEYTGTGGHHHVKFALHTHTNTVGDFWLGGIHVFGSTELRHREDGVAHFYFNDAHFRVTGTWLSGTEVVGVVARTSDPRTAPRVHYTVHLK